jgi:hypothetical protein
LKIPTYRNPNQNSAALWRIFPYNKNAPANRKEGLSTSRLLKNEEIGGIFVFSGSEF